MRRRLERDLRSALAEGRLLLHYQPRVALANGSVVAAEALLRWHHPRYGLVSAATFVPLAERSDLIVAIGATVLATACDEAVRWPSSALRPAPRVSVNISARQFANSALIDQLTATLGSSGLDPERLEIEFAERLVVDPDLDTLLLLAAVRDLGVGLVLDNFGAEFASLVTLKRLPITKVKIHRSLVRTLPTEAEDAAMVRAVIAAAHGLGLTVIAGGIESEAQREILVGLGCDEGQGYLLGRPEPPAALYARLSFPAGT